MFTPTSRLSERLLAPRLDTRTTDSHELARGRLANARMSFRQKIRLRSKALGRSRLKASKKYCSVVIAVVIVMIVAAWPPQLCAQTAGAKPSSDRNKSGAAQWSVQADKVRATWIWSPLSKSLFTRTYWTNWTRRSASSKSTSGDRNASNVPDLLILKTTVQNYTAGSVTRRAVTAVSGATKAERSQPALHTRRPDHSGRVVDGNVQFRGSNLRATHNLARNVAKKIKQSLLPELSPSAPALSIERIVGWAEFGASRI